MSIQSKLRVAALTSGRLQIHEGLQAPQSVWRRQVYPAAPNRSSPAPPLKRPRRPDALERAELHWCAIGGIAVNHWAAEPMVTRDVDFVVAFDEVERAWAALCGQRCPKTCSAGLRPSGTGDRAGFPAPGDMRV